MYQSLVRPLLFRLDAEAAHHLGMWALALADTAPTVSRWARTKAAPYNPALSMTVAGLHFPNPVGLAAGLDKNAEAITGLFSLGFGAVEVGTVTPRAQPGNEPPRLFRLPEHGALINRMGFNNHGMDAMAGRLRETSWKPGPVGVNIGKNKDTPLEAAADDYLQCAQYLGPLADYLVINLSSPNTPGLRALQEPKALGALLRTVRQHTVGVPLFLKIAPDLSDEAIDAVVDVALEHRLDALICGNTTMSRPIAHRYSSEAGGLSGRPLLSLSTHVLTRAFARAQGRLPLIGVGGIFSSEDAWQKVCAGASLVQLYTGLIYEGPSLVPRIVRGLESNLAQVGLKSLAQAVGRNA
jgi:dihydroorotate dehydrogenase